MKNNNGPEKQGEKVKGCPFSGEGAERLTEKEQYATQLIGLYVLINGMARGDAFLAGKIWGSLQKDKEHDYLGDLQNYMNSLRYDENNHARLNYTDFETSLIMSVKSQMRQVGENKVKIAEKSGVDCDEGFHVCLYKYGKDDTVSDYFLGKMREPTKDSPKSSSNYRPNLLADIAYIVENVINRTFSLEDLIREKPELKNGLEKADAMMMACKPVDLISS